jgi:hypothetical protein
MWVKKSKEKWEVEISKEVELGMENGSGKREVEL